MGRGAQKGGGGPRFRGQRVAAACRRWAGPHCVGRTVGGSVRGGGGGANLQEEGSTLFGVTTVEAPEP